MYQVMMLGLAGWTMMEHNQYSSLKSAKKRIADLISMGNRPDTLKLVQIIPFKYTIEVV